MWCWWVYVLSLPADREKTDSGFWSSEWSSRAVHMVRPHGLCSTIGACSEGDKTVFSAYIHNHNYCYCTGPCKQRQPAQDDLLHHYQHMHTVRKKKNNLQFGI